MNNAIKFEQFFTIISTYETFLIVANNIKTNFQNFKTLQNLLLSFENEITQQAGVSITLEKLSILLKILNNIKDLLAVIIKEQPEA